MSSYYTREEIAEAYDAQGLTQDFDQLVAYCAIFGYLSRKADGTIETPAESLENKLAKWADNSEEYFYADKVYSGAEFTEFYFDNWYSGDTIPTWIAIDYEATWERNLRHDFAYDFSLGYVFADH